jgi:hypothetical protein
MGARSCPPPKLARDKPVYRARTDSGRGATGTAKRDEPTEGPRTAARREHDCALSQHVEELHAFATSRREVRMIQGLHRNAYRCRDSEETRGFYEDFLALRFGTMRSRAAIRSAAT